MSDKSKIPLGWQDKWFNELYDFYPTNSLSRECLNYNNGKFKNIHYGDIHTSFTILHNVDVKTPFINDDIVLKNYELCQVGDMIIADASEDYKDIGKAIVIADLGGYNVVAGLHTIHARLTKRENIDYRFMAYLMKAFYIRYQIMRIATGISVLGISKANLSKIVFCLPPLPEQERIVEVLSCWDDAIDQISKIIALKERQKRGLMQKLLTGKVRLAGFSGEWRIESSESKHKWTIKELGDITYYFKGFAFMSQDYVDIGRKIVRVSDMNANDIGESSACISEANAKKYEKFKLKENDVIVTTVGSKPPVWGSLVGRAIIAKKKDTGSLLNQNAVCLRAISKFLNQQYLIYNLKKASYISHIVNIIRGNANQGSIALDDLFKYKIPLPPLPEQEIIADVLTTADKEIELLKRKLQVFQQQKRGLMQKLLTGKIRLKAKEGAC